MDSRSPGQVDTTSAFLIAGASTPPPEKALGSAPRPDWVEEARDALDEPGSFLAYEDSGRRMVVPLTRELTRIGRSLSAELRFDDATVSRRHAVVASGADGPRLLDDRSLNGVYVNGRRVQTHQLTDGDEIGIGRHALWFLENERVGSASGAGHEAAVAGQ